jgi:hypothetical protein
MLLPLPYSDDLEVIPESEPGHIARIVDITRQTLDEHFKRTGEGARDVHVKAHGCVRGEFRVLPGLPGELAQGLFARGASFPAVARFSNSAPWRQSDVLPDGRGMAIQVEQVASGASGSTDDSMTQDFLMVNAPAFIARDVSDYLKLEEARLKAQDRPASLALRLAARTWNPFQWCWRAVRSGVRIATQVPSHPASYTYFSMVPIRYGRFVAKYRVLPARSFKLRLSNLVGTRENAMRLALLESMRTEELRFEFQVQLRTSRTSMPIEDATVEWPERESPYQTVAHFIVPPQDILVTEARQQCEQRSFNVWNALPEHRPLGGINRVRMPVYVESAGYRFRSRLKDSGLS